MPEFMAPGLSDRAPLTGLEPGRDARNGAKAATVEPQAGQRGPSGARARAVEIGKVSFIRSRLGESRRR